MKKTVLSFLLALILCFTACGSKSTYEKVISQLENGDFDQVTYYDEDMIKEIADKLSSIGIGIRGNVLNIVHFTKIGTTDNDWVYVYSFELEEDSKTFMDKYAKNWQNARQEGTVVFYGNSSLIDEVRV